MAHKQNRNSQEICRLSWFLMEMDEGQVKEGRTNGRILNEIVHFMDFIDNDPTNKYLDHNIKFNCNHGIMEGRVIMASDDRHYVEQHFKKLIKNREATAIDRNLTKKFLVLYKKGNSLITLSIVHEKEIQWSYDVRLNEKPMQAHIRDGIVQRQTTILFEHESDELMETQLNALKDRFFNSVSIVFISF